MKTLEQELEIALRAEAPRPTAEFAEALDRKVERGFQRPSGQPRFKWTQNFPFAPVIGGIAALAVVIVLISTAGGGSGTGGSSSSGSTAASSATEQASPKAASGAQVAPNAPVARPRRVERSAALTLGAPSSKLEDVANQVIAVTDRHRGFVLHSTVTSGGSSTGGSFELRVPSGELQSTLSDLSALADVRSRTQATSDITAPYNAVQNQLGEARALRHSLLARLAGATTDTEAQALRARIHEANAQIRALSSQFARLQTRARLATIDVTLVREKARHDSGTGGVGGAFHDGLHSLAVSFGIALRVLGVVLPLALVAGLGWLGAAVFKRRRREAALF